MVIGRSFMEIETLFKEQNAVMADVPFVEYLNFESMSEGIHMIIGFKSAKVLCGKGNIRAITIPGRKIVSCLHKGNYTELASLYREMQEWIAAKGYKSSGASIEYYYSKPGTSEEKTSAPTASKHGSRPCWATSGRSPDGGTISSRPTSTAISCWRSCRPMPQRSTQAAGCS